jgi:hypothetical protein
METLRTLDSLLSSTHTSTGRLENYSLSQVLPSPCLTNLYSKHESRYSLGLGSGAQYTAEMALYGIINIPRVIKICAGVQALLRFRFRNLRGCIFGNTDGGIYDLHS